MNSCELSQCRVCAGEHGHPGQAVEAGREEGDRQREVQGGPNIPRQAQEDDRGRKKTKRYARAAEFYFLQCIERLFVFFISAPTRSP
jgi:hypothetical protein